MMYSINNINNFQFYELDCLDMLFLLEICGIINWNFYKNMDTKLKQLIIIYYENQ